MAMINNSPADLFSALNPAQAGEASRSRNVSDMGSDDFLTLMIAQMKNQDPTQPMDQMAFMSQLAQFGTLSGVQELNGAFGDLSTNLTGAQAVQASSLVGRSVATDNQMAALAPVGRNDNGDVVNLLSATVDMGSYSEGGVFEVRDSSGRLVFSGDLPSGSGHMPVVWDGQAADGSYLPPGDYQISAQVIRGGAGFTAPVYGHDTVVSVALGANNTVTLNLASGRSIDVSDVKEFF
jgi:flagellar basal-body rod modification protein FlgD